jgi:DNA polymerase
MGVSEVIIKRKSSKSQINKSDGHSDVAVVREEGELFGEMDPKYLGEPEFESLEAHYNQICNCHSCPLGKTRNKFVYGVGNPNADLVFIGEGPGRDEDLKGEPFVGRAGKLLDKILEAINFTREDIYIANMVKCRPPENRDPLPEEMEACNAYLIEQLRLIRPKLICALGRVAAQALLQTKTPLGKLRGQWHNFMGIEVLVTYHPAALLRFQAYKRDTWEDMQKLRARYDEVTK